MHVEVAPCSFKKMIFFDCGGLSCKEHLIKDSTKVFKMSTSRKQVLSLSCFFDPCFVFVVSYFRSMLKCF